MKLTNNVLTTQEWSIYMFLKGFHNGEKSAISMPKLAMQFSVSQRKLREMITNIILYKFGYLKVCSTDRGYFVATSEEELQKALEIMKSRVRTSLEKYFATSHENKSWLYSLINELQEKYDTPANKQTTIKFNGWEKDVNYFGETKNEKYESLFDFEN